jgi:hypothetical protein
VTAVYFVQEGGFGPIKIGFAKNPFKQLSRHMQSKHPEFAADA